MKNLIIISLFAAIATLSSCSNQQMNTAQNDRNAVLSKQLEQNTFSSAVVSAENQTNLSANAGNEITYTQPTTDKRFETVNILNSQSISKLSKKDKIKVLSLKLLNTLNPNQIEKLKIEVSKLSYAKSIKNINKPEVVQKTQVLSIGQIITGIIVGAIGLALIALAAAGVFVPSIVGLIWVAGVIFFIAGVILVLVGMF